LYNNHAGEEEKSLEHKSQDAQLKKHGIPLPNASRGQRPKGKKKKQKEEYPIINLTTKKQPGKKKKIQPMGIRGMKQKKKTEINGKPHGQP